MHIHSLPLRRAIAAVVVACATTLGAVLALAGTSPAVASVPSCTTSSLVIWLDTHGNGTAGGTYYDLQFTNISAHSCTVYGYPGVSAVTLSGHQLGSAASRNSQHAAALLTLAPYSSSNAAGTWATAVLRITDAGVYSPSTCGTTTAAGLRVYPPGQTASQFVPFPFRACSHSGSTILTAEALQHGLTTG